MDNTTLEQLKRIPEFQHYSHDVLEQLMAKSQVTSYSKGDFIIKAEEPVPFIGIITKGLVRAYERMNNQEENVWGLLQEGEFCTCPIGLRQSDVIESANFQALENVQLLSFPLSEFRRILGQNPTLWSQTLENLSFRAIRNLQEKSKLLNMSAEERYTYFVEQHPDLIFRVPLGQVSSFLGIRQSSLSRIRRNLSQRRAVQV